MGGIYLDTCCIVYLIEGAHPFREKVIAALKEHGIDSGSSVITSRLSMLECRVHPVRNNDKTLLSAYDAFFSMERLIIADIDQQVIDAATQIRATYRFHTPDAIHLATAIQQSASVFLTGDLALKRFLEIDVHVLG